MALTAGPRATGQKLSRGWEVGSIRPGAGFLDLLGGALSLHKASSSLRVTITTPRAKALAGAAGPTSFKASSTKRECSLGWSSCSLLASGRGGRALGERSLGGASASASALRAGRGGAGAGLAVVALARLLAAAFERSGSTGGGAAERELGPSQAPMPSSPSAAKHQRFNHHLAGAAAGCSRPGR